MMAWVLVGTLSLSACSKDDDPTPEVSGDSMFTMKIDDQVWNATATAMWTQKDEDESGEFYHVGIGAHRVDSRGEDYAEVIQMYMVIPASDFQNPKGHYPISLRPVGMRDQATAVFASKEDTWVSRQVADNTLAVGVVEITDFKIGEQNVAGQPAGTLGYTRLAGTFNVDLMSTNNPSGPTLKITGGKFNVHVGVLVTD